VTAVPHIDPQQASAIGGRTLEVFTGTPRLNAWLFSKLAPHVHGDVLEIGSGIGNLSGLIVDQATTVVLSDMEAHYLDALATAFADDPRVTVAPYDLDGEPSVTIASRRFDTIVAVNVVEHIRDDHALVRRLTALLKPGGKLVVYVPACPFAYGSLDRALGHYRRYTPQSLTALLESSGLKTPRPAYMNLFGLFGWAINGRLLRRERLSPRQLAVFERFMSLFRLEDRVHLPIGLGIYVAAQKPGQ
jgi:SAM-dependent methyltransferase